VTRRRGRPSRQERPGASGCERAPRSARARRAPHAREFLRAAAQPTAGSPLVRVWLASKTTGFWILACVSVGSSLVVVVGARHASAVQRWSLVVGADGMPRRYSVGRWSVVKTIVKQLVQAHGGWSGPPSAPGPGRNVRIYAARVPNDDGLNLI